ncbi:MAG: IMS domain-containing protein [Cyanobacteria bacterium]|nr:IMS domain-containing protein [Cyanobacteriota bacterium]
MRIPLDYYRILGLPIQATAEQLTQAHRDRTLQLPRREYSEVAIEARKTLIDEAYTVLSDAERRRDYDTQFLARAYAPVESVLEGATPAEADPNAGATGEAALRSLAAEEDPGVPADATTYTPTIEIDGPQLTGALLVLLELGEYELVIRLGRPYLTSGSQPLQDGRFGDPKRVIGDIVLTLALSCLELGREQWQQRQYENAAESLETGQELLLRENVFPAIRSELKSDLYKLRPYRVLELVARPLEHTAGRRQGIKLLKAMLQDRSGIDGAEDDLSGLSTDDFLRFIQQLRSYLTAGEQQEIFEGEARRPSAVAIYLAVYALLARGFAFHQPALVPRAKQLLVRVGSQQDVHLEQSVCALLLGQTEEASRALERSQEYEPLAFIREHSQASQDLLPGLCLYAERWLREEVFPHFRDLADQQTTLKEYFADPQVQAYLEAMPAMANRSEGGATAAMGTIGDAPSPFANSTVGTGLLTTPPSEDTPWEPLTTNGTRPGLSGRMEEVVAPGPTVAERVSQLSPEGKLNGSTAASPRRSRVKPAPFRPRSAAPASGATPASGGRSPRWGRLTLVAILGLFSLGLLGVLTIRTVRGLASALGGPKLQQPALDVQLNEPPVEIPAAPEPRAEIGVQDIAKRAIDNWLAAKREALGESHNIDGLNTILLDPALSQWRNRAESGARENWYWEYNHSVEVLKVDPEDPAAETLTVDAKITEQANFYELGVRNLGASYDETLTMRYELVRQDGNWLVKTMDKVD